MGKNPDECKSAHSSFLDANQILPVSKQKLLEPASLVSCVMLPGKNHDKEQEMPTLTLEVSSGRPEDFGPLGRDDERSE